jgi:ADP-ribose pyrophosphatase YjhB (NUDIX family)
MQEFTSDTYTMKAFRTIHEKAKECLKELEAYTGQLNQEYILEEIDQYGPIDEPTKFKLHKLLMDIATVSSEPFNWLLTVQEGFYTAVDILAFYYNIQDNDTHQLLIIKRPDGKLAPIGGFTKYGETPEQTAVREAYEETKIGVPQSTLRLLGVYGNPDRDPRPEHIVSIAYIGLTQDWPVITQEAPEAFAYTYDQVKETYPHDWFAKDHRQMALSAFERLVNQRTSMIIDLQKSH